MAEGRPADPDVVEAIGCLYASGFAAASVTTTGSAIRTFLVNFRQGVVTEAEVAPRDYLAWPKKPVCICGPVVESPSTIRDECLAVPVRSGVYVCPFVDELEELGREGLAAAASPRFVPRRLRRLEPLPDALIPEVCYEDGMPDDEWGKVAAALHDGGYAVLRSHRQDGVSPFHGRVLSSRVGWGRPTFLMSAAFADEMFPIEMLSVRVYAARHVPVEMITTPAFSKETGWEMPTVDVFVVSPESPEASATLRFYEAMSGRRFFMTMTSFAVPVGSASVFGYNGATRMSQVEIAKIGDDGV